MAFVGSNSANSVTSSQTVSVAYTATGGNALVVGACGGAGTAASTTCGDGSNTYSLLDSGADPFNGAPVAIFTAKNISGGSLTITVTFSASSATKTILVAEYSGRDTTTLVTAHALLSNDPGNDPVSSGSVTAAASDDVVGIGFNTEEGFGTLVAGSGYTQRQNEQGAYPFGMIEDQVAFAGGSIAATFTKSGVIRRCQVAVICLAVAAGGGGPTTAQMMAAVGDHVRSGGMYGRRWR